MAWRRRGRSRFGYGGGGFGSWAPYVPVAERRKNAAATARSLEAATGRKLQPVRIDGRTMAHTFWGKAWCENLESYSDFANRLPRGRSYARNGSVVDLQLEGGQVSALVQGSSLYTVKIVVSPVRAALYAAVVAACAGKIDSLVELLQGKLSRGVMEVIAQGGTGLFPTPDEMTFSCNCPDWASMCKHVAAALYGVGARLDDAPDLLFRLRGSDPTALVTTAATGAFAGRSLAREKVLDTDLASVFGIDLDLDIHLGKGPASAIAPRPVGAKIAATARARTGARTPAALGAGKLSAGKPALKRPSLRAAKATAARTAGKVAVKPAVAKARPKAVATAATTIAAKAARETSVTTARKATARPAVKTVAKRR